MSQLAYCSVEQIIDLQEVLDQIRAWPGMREAKPGIFYIKQDPFLHLLRNPEQRWINARRGVKWGKPIEIPQTLTEFDRRRIVRELKDRYLRTAFALSRRVIA